MAKPTRTRRRRAPARPAAAADVAAPAASEAAPPPPPPTPSTHPGCWRDVEVPWTTWVVFRLVFFGLHAVDAFLQISHAPRYGAGGFNVPHLPFPPLPDPSRAGMTFVYGTLAIGFALIALGVGVRALLPLVAALYGYAYFVSQLDSYQHHYLMWLVLVILCFVPTAPTSVGADGRGWLRAWALRLVLAQLAILYLWAAIAKLDPAWLDGTLLAQQIKPGRVRRLVAAIGFATMAKLVLATELALAATVWTRRLRWVALALGLGLHVGIELVDLEIGLFSYFMVALYLLLAPAAVPALLAQTGAAVIAPLGRVPARFQLGIAAAALTLATVVVIRHPLPLAGAAVVGLLAVAVAVIAARAGGVAALVRPVAAGAVAVGLVAILLTTTDVAADHFRTWAGASRRMHLPTERAAYQGLLAVEPRSEYAHYYLGLLDQQAGDTAAALAHFTAAERAAPTRTRAYLAEAAALVAAGRPADAAAALDRGLAAVPGDAELARRRAALGTPP
ncbi:MAG: HTTM domain-containing protein [Kofleriaceae bacterium]